MALLEPMEALLKDAVGQLPFDVAGIVTIDFASGQLEIVEYINGKKNALTPLWYDLASITKTMTLATYALAKKFQLPKELELLIDHRAGLIFWGLISQQGWREQMLSYTIAPSPTLYSDFSALRAMLEIEKKEGKSLYQCVSQYWDSELVHWKKIPPGARCEITGHREGKPICGEVHDPNAYCVEEELSHAGLFATAKGLGQTLLNLDRQLGLLTKMHHLLLEQRSEFDRFVWGWDTPQGADSTAGANVPSTVFGHLGFVGNSVWIDAQSKRGLVLFTNQSRYAWYERKALTALRRKLYSSFWQLS